MSDEERARAERVARLKARVREGRYDVDPDALAGKLLEHGALDGDPGGPEDAPDEDAASPETEGGASEAAADADHDGGDDEEGEDAAEEGAEA